MRNPPKGETWIHIDKFGKKNVWAIQHWTGTKKSRLVYRTAREIRFEIKGKTGVSLKQPKAVMRIKRAWVIIVKGIAYVTNTDKQDANT